MVREPMTWPQIWPFELTIYQDKSCDQVTPLEFLKIGICLDATKNLSITFCKCCLCYLGIEYIYHQYVALDKTKTCQHPIHDYLNTIEHKWGLSLYCLAFDPTCVTKDG
jgi:hypothetical protein